MTVKALKGFKDILPDEARTWQIIEQTARDIFHRFGFSEIKTPILEKTELFARSIGEATDIVEKEMYTFEDRNGASITMRPEGTASVLRSFIEHGLHVQRPVQRLYTMGPMFRYERPQKGRLRQFHQMSVEVLGADNPKVDAEVIAMARLLLYELGISVSLEINSLGCRRCRPSFNSRLVEFLEECAGLLCPDCERRRRTNPLRVLDCKNEKCRTLFDKAPVISDHLCDQCRDHFTDTEDGLKLLDIPYSVNPFMVRGLDYYTRTTFELVSDALGAQSAVGAGGRYDGLIKELGGPDIPGIGFAMGIERLALLINQQGKKADATSIDLFVAALGKAARETAFKIVHSLRVKGLQIAMDHEGRSLKSQMKQAGRLNSRYTFIIGDDELENGVGALRNMVTHDQSPVPLPGDLEGWAIKMVEIIN
ncbi:MAG: histidine--tRNA ligase [Thermodesulfobacteriota bacterium]|nr:histidine--tRNA ligase [Thermodesulfobacteriota bacterium]